VEMMRRRVGLPDDPFNCLAPRGAKDMIRCNDLVHDFLRMETDKTGIGQVDAQSVNSAVQEVRYAEPIVKGLWADAFRGIKKTFVPVTVHYFGVAGTTREVARTRCPVVLENAFFCPAERAIFYDAVFMGRLLAAVAKQTQTSGRYSVIAVFGHEMAHAAVAQLQLGYNDKDEELVADCFAGVTVKAVSDVEAGNSRATQILHEITPREEGSAGLAVLGSISVAGGNYGNAEERRRYYLTGFEDGGPACQPSLLRR
jgi:predicted metalloprotease